MIQFTPRRTSSTRYAYLQQWPRTGPTVAVKQQRAAAKAKAEAAKAESVESLVRKIMLYDRLLAKALAELSHYQDPNSRAAQRMAQKMAQVAARRDRLLESLKGADPQTYEKVVREGLVEWTPSKLTRNLMGFGAPSNTGKGISGKWVLLGSMVLYLLLQKKD